ncbi:hypothetical protein ACJ7V3_07890 [Halomonas elongata]|uniref:hypothetical protein n=1 Tax=Halomonas elongata TaxID=2746 RepID=UPI0038D516CD
MFQTQGISAILAAPKKIVASLGKYALTYVQDTGATLPAVLIYAGTLSSQEDIEVLEMKMYHKAIAFSIIAGSFGLAGSAIAHDGGHQASDQENANTPMMEMMGSDMEAQGGMMEMMARCNKMMGQMQSEEG